MGYGLMKPRLRPLAITAKGMYNTKQDLDTLSEAWW